MSTLLDKKGAGDETGRMKKYAIMRTRKLKTDGNVGASLSHAWRDRETPNADQSKTPRNIHMISNNRNEALARYRKLLPEKVRKNGIRCIEYLITYSPKALKTPEERAKYLVNEYANLEKEELAVSIQKIKKRLGFDQAKLALEYLEKDDFYQVALITLKYYDKFYLRGLSRRDPSKIKECKLSTINHEENAEMLIKFVRDE